MLKRITLEGSKIGWTVVQETISGYDKSTTTLQLQRQSKFMSFTFVTEIECININVSIVEFESVKCMNWNDIPGHCFLAKLRYLL